MKKSLLFCLVAALCWTSCKNDKPDSAQQNPGEGSNAAMVHNPASAGNTPADTNQLARITYEQTEFDFGQVTEGDVVEHSFKFTNTGKVPLTILKARSTCGCTIPDTRKNPIPPGESSVITARFNTEGKHNEQKKIIHITANTFPGETSVMLKGFVNPAKE